MPPAYPTSGVKPRFDGKGSEFGLIHRELPIYCGMFDVDRMTARAEMNLELTKQDVCFFEYRTNFTTAQLTVKAMFEIKYNDSSYVRESMSASVGTSTWAQIELCKLLDCRYFFVIGTNGKQPFTFYERIDGMFENRGILSYTEDDKKEAINDFWRRIGLI